MKKILFSVALTLAATMSVQAQVVVLGSGKTQMGTPMNGHIIANEATLNIWSIMTPQSLGGKMGGGTISFGNGDNAMIGGDGLTGALKLTASKNFGLIVGNKATGFSYSDNSKQFQFNFNVQAPSFLTSSDARFKKNVSSLDGLHSGLLDLNPVSYNLSYPIKTDNGDANGKLSKATENYSDERTHFGFVAQEIQKVYPNLVVEDEEGMLSIDYIGFIPILVDAYKDLSNKVKEQEEFISDIMKSVAPSFKPASVEGLFEDKAVLKQNQPNPFNSSTIIECTVPRNVTSAFIYIYDMQGKQINRMEIRDRGTVQTFVEAASLTPGMYIYSLIADGQEIDSKRMILTD